ncbi:ABC transporter permease [Candidatus Xianfuyuplasma coldseepsis]|uniref:ABC transporter permease subunit n=1 Tax=Candidatus Xianfuyuplasma coldseepsis TaxID=2782163 RepID=A0A7L7KS66_9MOLU|nr:ABC transporter permease [Xianfuyuplasma coldseepsis]QMS85661.1 ABC transporter permease subunit [Xianfuyuplasma coldseepsis]
MKRLIKVEFKRNFKSLLMWCGIVGGLAALMLAMFPAFKDAFSQLEELLSVYPEAFLEAFGMGEGGLVMSEIYGWFGVEGYLFTMLIGGSYAGILGGSILSKEEDDKTIEFLLAKPISRDHIVFGKAIVVVINLTILNAFISIILLIAFSIFGTLDVAKWLLFSFAPLLAQLIFASISFLVSIFITKSRQVISVSLGVVIGMYVVDLISKLTDQAENLKYITPYEYVNAVTIVNEKKIEPLYLLISVLVIAVTIIASWQLYKKKDITA